MKITIEVPDDISTSQLEMARDAIKAQWPLKVGDTVARITSVANREWEIVAIDDDRAWLKRIDTNGCVRRTADSLARLERV